MHSICAINHIKGPTITSQIIRNSMVLEMQKTIKVEGNWTTQMNPKRGLVDGSQKPYIVSVSWRKKKTCISIPQ